MAALVGYASSDEDEEVVDAVPAEATDTVASKSEPEKREPEKPIAKPQSPISAPAKDSAASVEKGEPVVIGPVHQNAVPLGPSLPPVEASTNTEADTNQAPLSPYSANRALLRDLTLPSVPNMDIPPSPPGSPPPGANKKFEQFLDLKKKGVHFNAKLEQSSALRNPSLMDKLLKFTEIDERAQYETTLPTELWDPNGFPEYAFRDKLRKSREKTAKAREAEKSAGGRSTVDFVPSTTPSGSSTSNAGGLARGGKRKSGWN